MENNIELSLKSVVYSKLQNDAYVMMLVEDKGDRQIPIIIGGYEAQAIIIAIEKIKSPRPLTHDLFCNFATAQKIELQRVEIYKFRDGIFYSRLFMKKEGEEQPILLEARTSDAVALAIRCHCPIYTNEELLVETGIALSKISKATKRVAKTEKQSIEKLQKLMSQAIAEENYEQAAIIRDEIRKRNA